MYTNYFWKRLNTISGRKFLYVTAGVIGILSCVEIDVNKAKIFRAGTQESMVNSNECYYVEILLHVDLDLLLLISMIVFGALLHKVFTYGQGEGHIQGHSVRAECTCADTQQISCRRHDHSLLRELSKHLPNVDLLYDIGLHLRIETWVIDACREDNRSITVAVFDMLRKWYQTQDGLGKNSNGLEELKRALCRSNVGNYVQTVIQKHFDER